MTNHDADSRPLGAGVVNRGPRLFATPADEPRARRASDVVSLALSLVLLAAISLAAIPSPGFAQEISRLLAAIPGFLDAAWQVIADLLVLIAVCLVVGTFVRRRWSVARDVLFAVGVAFVVWLVVGRVVVGSWPAIWDSLRAASPPAWYPAPRLALCGAVVMTASPHLTRPLRRLGRSLLLLGALAVAALGATAPLGAVAGLLVAAIAAATVHLAFGSSGGRPGLDVVEEALVELGVRTGSLDAADRQQAGVFVVNGTDAQGQALVVKVYGRDAHDAAVLSTLWRTVWYREAGSPLRFGRLQQVEREAFLTVFAAQAGVPTDQVVTAGATASEDALLVLRRSGSVLAETPDRRDDPAVVPAVWALLRRLHGAGVAHGQIDDRHLLVDGDRLGLVDFRGATMATRDARRRTDQVQALVTTALLVGEERAAASAVEALGRQELAALLPYVQPPTLTPLQRRRHREREVDLDLLRASSADAAETEAPALMQLRRVTLGSLVRVLLPAIAVIVLISALAGLDFAELADELRDAAWWLIALAFLLAQLPRFTQAISTLGAAPSPLPLGPVYGLQLAISYINLVIPTSAARVAVNIRFFQRHGVPPGAALTAGAIDGFISLVMEAVLLAALLLFTPASLDLDLDAAIDSAAPLLAVVIVITAVGLLVIAAVARWRRFVVGWAKRLATEAWSAVRGLRSPRRVALLLGGSLATELLFPLALATFTLALGFSVSLGEVLLINISVALLSALVPVPGGIGVVEGGLTFGLVQAGVPEQVALVAVLMYRLSTTYLPPIWGYFAFRWLERNDHL